MKIAAAVSLIFTLTLSHIGFLAIGMEIETRRNEAEQKRIADLPKPAPVRAQCTPWACSKQEFSEYREACLTRARISKVMPK